MRRNQSFLSLVLLACSLTGSSFSQEITSLVLIDAKRDIELNPLNEKNTVDLEELNSDEISISAKILGKIGSVAFFVNNDLIQVENNPPYALVGNKGDDFYSWKPNLETYNITVQIFSGRSGKGLLLDTHSIEIVFTKSLTQPKINSLILVDAESDQDIAPIAEGAIFNLNRLNTSKLNIRAEVSPNTESVQFGYQDNPIYHLENLPVYAIGGNSGDDYRDWPFELGENLVSAQAFSENKAGGEPGAKFEVNFSIIDEPETPNLPVVLRLNSGGQKVTIDGITFEEDDYHQGDGKSYSNPNIEEINGTDLDEVYKSERSTTSNLGSFGYEIPVTNGTYLVRLHFSEIYWGATSGGSGGNGKRIFDVTLEDRAVLQNFDMNAETLPMTAIVKEFETSVVDNELNIFFQATVNQPKIAAIEIFGNGNILQEKSCGLTNLANSEFSKVESHSVKIDGKLYVLAGFLSGLKVTPATEIYDPQTNRWSSGAPMPLAVTHMGAVGVGDEIWIISGFAGNHPGVATDRVQIYNTKDDFWYEGPPIPEPRGSGAAVFNEGKIHFFGGLLPNRFTDVGDHYVLDVNDLEAGWQNAAPLPNPRNHLSAASVNGLIYAIGGQYGHDRGVSDQNLLHEYDPISDTWTRKADLPTARSHFEPGTMVHNEKIIIVGGRKGNTFFSEVTEYDPAKDSWTEKCELPTKLLAPAAKVFGDKLIVANGGENGTCCPKNTTIAMTIEPETKGMPDLNILVYHETNGFRHGSIEAGIAMIEGFADEFNWNITVSDQSSHFNPEFLNTINTVIWLNTSGNNLLTTSEQIAFENYIQRGGGFIGIHAATDTYRDGSWPWYNDLVGGIVQTAPNHTPNNTNNTLQIVNNHVTVNHLGTTWEKLDEYYYWDLNGGYLSPDNIVLIKTEATGANSYDRSRPITWYKLFDGGKSFYTALGHNASDYETDENFKKMILEAIFWTGNHDFSNLDETPLQSSLLAESIKVYPIPANDNVFIYSEYFNPDNPASYKLYTMEGKLVQHGQLIGENTKVNLAGMLDGYLLLLISNKDVTLTKLIIVR
ncbi:Cytochrome c class I [Croceitalea dokdonensis DOKDO 023]|uniref:Cytochrome c class I n=1 Tax=Croceitalea dokdonensis DOKDO 023 TaxID=1300341 RepID=A0A0P7ABA9_9FLAO|nr:ThuA domain-containing protein [Croceitalea dokdonensis]KPM30405.1 Cytochrome c class I [Croceitalea dokdonensis DOKDO 023]